MPAESLNFPGASGKRKKNANVKTQVGKELLSRPIWLPTCVVLYKVKYPETRVSCSAVSWHPLYGKIVIVQGQILRHGCSLCKCAQLGQEAGIGYELPIWMLDSVCCSRMQPAGKPQACWLALLSLKELWQEAMG